MPNDVQDWVNQTGLTLRPPYVGAFAAQTAATNAGSPYTLLTLAYALAFSVGGFLFTAANRTAGAAGLLNVFLNNVTRTTNVILLSGIVTPVAPLVVTWPGPFDISTALANLGAQTGDVIIVELVVVDLVGVSSVDVAVSFLYSQQ